MNKHLKNRMILILSVFFLALVIIGTAGAADAEDSIEKVNTVPTDTINDNPVSDGDFEILSDESDGNFTDLKSLIDNAEENSTVTLDRNYTFNSGDSNELIIDKVLIIDGNNMSIDAGKNTFSIYVNSSNVVLKNINFINFRNTITWNGANGQLENSLIQNSSGVLWNGDYGKITDSTFHSNTGTGFYNVGYRAGALYFGGYNMSVYNSKFINNSVANYGGAIQMGSGLISGCYFENNTAYGQWGGAIMVESLYKDYMVIYNSTFKNNKAGGRGGAIGSDTPNIKVYDCEFINNTAITGGAIYTRYDGPGLEIGFCNFTDNNATEAGGALCSDASSVKVDNCNFNNNLAPEGSAIYNTGDGLSLSQSNFTGNTVDDSIVVSPDFYSKEIGGSDEVNLTNSTLENRDFYVSVDGIGDGSDITNPSNFTYAYDKIASGNTIYFLSGTYDIYQQINKKIDLIGISDVIMQNDTGRVFDVSVSVTINNIHFKNCIDSALSLNAPNTIIDSCNFTNNAGDVGAIKNYQFSNITNCIFANNTGLVYDDVNPDYIKFTFTDNLFQGTYTLKDKYVKGYVTLVPKATPYETVADIYVDDVLFDSFIYSEAADYMIQNLTLGNHNIRVVFTSPFNEYSTLEDKKVSVFNNLILYVSPDGDGDGYSIDNPTNWNDMLEEIAPKYTIVLLNGTFNVSDTQFDCENIKITGSGNTIVCSDNGYTIFSVNSDNVEVSNISFSGGSIAWNGANGTLNDCEFINCNSTGNGGAVLWTGANGTINECGFENCSAAKGAAVYWSGEEGNITDSYFKDCTANNGGAIYLLKASNTNIINSNFTNCSTIAIAANVNSGGGAIFLDSLSNTTIAGCKFNDCSVNGSRTAGGAIFVQTSNNITFYQSEFINCNANTTHDRVGGGAIFWYSGWGSRANGNGNFIDSNFTNCTTNYNGGAIYWGIANNCTVSGSTFSNCNAKDGGAIYMGAQDAAHYGSMYSQITDSQFINCSAARNGGAIGWFENNNMNTPDSNIANSTFENCSATGSGGTIYSTARNVLVSYNALLNNTYYIPNAMNTYNWYGNNTPNVNVPYLQVNWDKVYDPLVTGEWNGVLNVYFVKNDTDEPVDVSWNRPVDYTITSGDADVKDENTDVYGKIYTTSTETVKVKAKVDNQELDELEFGSTNRTGFTELQNLIKGIKANETLVLNNNYTYTVDDEELINGVVIDKAITVALNDSSISGNNSAKNVFNIVCDDVILENITVKDVNGSAVTAVGDNIQINDLTAENINGSAIEVTGDNTIITNLNLPEHSAIAVNITGDNTTIRNIDSSVTDEDIIVNGNINIDVSVDDVVYPDAATLIVNAGVDGNYTATVNDKEYNITVKNGTASIVLEVLPADTYDATVIGQFGEDSPISTGSTNFSVIEINIPEIVENKTTELPIDLPSDATGEISLLVDGEVVDTKEVVDGEVVLEIPPLDAGQHNITVSYPGNDEHNAFNKTFDATVKVDTNANITIPEIIENETTEIPVDLPEDATGNVSIMVDGELMDSQELVNGSAVLEIPQLDAGHHNISIIYPGDDKYASINQTSDVQVKVEGEFNVTEPEVYENQTTEIPVELPEDATGNVSVMVDGELVDTQELVNGSAVLEIPALSKENHTITVTYTGDDKYASQCEEFNVSVLDDVIITANDLNKYYSAPDKFEVNVTDSKGNPLTNKSVNITVNGVTYIRTTNENGSACLNIRLRPGEYEAVVNMGNVTLNKNITVLSTINGTDIVKIFRNGTQYYVTIKGADGSYLPEGSKVEFNINGVLYNRTVKGDEGLVKLNINLDEGEYIITATNLETNDSVSNNITVLSRIAGEDITKYFKNDTLYEVTLLDDNGNPVGAGVSVTFNVNGIFYTRYTNDEGVAKLNINLPPGDWIVTANYSECLASNKIKVLPVLTADNLVKQQGADTPFVATLLNGQGQPYENQKVTFNINGVFYVSNTDANGQAKLVANLPNGKYIVTSSYNGCSISNNLTITN